MILRSYVNFWGELSRFDTGYTGKSDSLAHVGHGSCGCPILDSVQGQVGRGLEQPGIVEGVPAHGRGLEQGDF